MKEKILIVENQIIQFRRISEHLARKGYNTIPSKKEYSSFLDYVRVKINPQYESTYKNRCFDKIIAYIAKESPDLIIMDHILGGSCKCETGIGLAEKLFTVTPLPFLFLSRTEHSEKNRLLDYDRFRKAYPGMSEWAHKGYFGDEILEEGYFTSYVIPLIEKLLPQNKSIEMRNHINNLLLLTFSNSEHKLQLTRLKEKLNGNVEIPDDIFNIIEKHAQEKDAYFAPDELRALNIMINT